MLGGKCADLSRPVIKAFSHQRAVAGIRIGVELIQALNQLGQQRVQAVSRAFPKAFYVFVLDIYKQFVY